MQGTIVQLIRELMEIQGLTIREVSAQIAQKYGGSKLGYTQQVSRILNDPDYDPSFSTLQKVFSALNYSFWHSGSLMLAHQVDLSHLETRLMGLSEEVLDLKLTVQQIQTVLEQQAIVEPTPKA